MSDNVSFYSVEKMAGEELYNRNGLNFALGFIVVLPLQTLTQIPQKVVSSLSVHLQQITKPENSTKTHIEILKEILCVCLTSASHKCGKKNGLHKQCFSGP